MEVAMRGLSRRGWVIAVVLCLGIARAGLGQGLVAPAPGADLERLSRRMAEGVRDLADDIAAGPGRTPQGQYLERDARELQRSTGEWYTLIRGNVAPFQVRRSYAGLDVSWHRLRGQLDQPGLMNQAIADEARRVEQADAQLHQALGLNAYPANFDGPPAAPTGLDEVRRLAYALAQRGEALAATIQADYAADPNARLLVNDSAQLARTVDAFYDSLNNSATAAQPGYARASFVPIVAQANGFGVNLDRVGRSPRAQASWDAYTAVHNLLRNSLDLNNPTPDGLPQNNLNFNPNVATGGIAYNPNANPAAPVGAWAEQLDRQVDDLLANFAPTARVVPEGGEMLEDMQRLRRAVVDFRRDVAQGFPAGRLAFEFREVDEHWRRLARRIERVAVARGRATGPNIQRVGQIGQTCEQIHRVLGMPGFAPTFGPN